MPSETAGAGRGLDRRRACCGLVLATPLLIGSIARPQDPPDDPAQDALRLTANLLTRMAAVVQLDGQPAVLVLDTGAERSAVSRELAERLALPPGPPVLVHGVTQAQITDTVRVRTLRFAGRTLEDLALPVFEQSEMSANGLLGLDMLGGLRLSLDLVRRSIRVAAPGETTLAAGSASLIPRRGLRRSRAERGRFGQLILLTTEAEGVSVRAFVDSGAQYSIGNMALARAVSAIRPGAVAAQLFGVNGQVLAALPGRVGDLRVGGQRLGSTPLYFADVHAFEALDMADRPALLLGADILYRFRSLDLDYAQGRIGFGPLRRFDRPAPASGAC
ncbi:MAG: aspartyl protease family protein [Alphaproteobacteria bacterium]|nr:aspartyl protease family protein [Alphaproteobacteria bacterium]